MEHLFRRQESDGIRNVSRLSGDLVCGCTGEIRSSSFPSQQIMNGQIRNTVGRGQSRQGAKEYYAVGCVAGAQPGEGRSRRKD